MPPPQNDSIRRLRKILFVVAMEIEMKSLESKLKDTETVILNESLGLKVARSKIENREIYLLESGIGLVNAAVATAFAAEQIKPDAIFLLGVAGALSPSLHIGEAIVAQQVIQHDAVFTGENVRELMVPGQLHLSIEPHLRNTPILSLKSELSDWVYEAFTSEEHRVQQGTLLSGSEFVGSVDRKRALAKVDPQALAVEMEAVGVIQIAKRFGIPVVVSKTIADRMNPNGSISSDYLMFSSAAAENAAIIVQRIVEAWRE